ncbi:MAG: alpha/beta fold hydrolase [Syntrophomonas sp.]
MADIHQQARPFLLSGNNDTAVLFIHGFTASPTEVYPTAWLLHEMNGCTINGLLLPGHGSTPEDMNRINWEEWYRAVEKAIRSLQKDYRKVWAAGLSMGGLLAIHAGVNCPGLDGVISINAPVFIKAPLFKWLAPFLQIFKPYLPKGNIALIRQLQAQGRFAYDCTPVQAFRSMMKLRDMVVGEIEGLTVPLLLMQSGQDESVKTVSARYLAQKAHKAEAKIVDLPGSRHVATMGPEKQLIAREMAAFMKY